MHNWVNISIKMYPIEAGMCLLSLTAEAKAQNSLLWVDTQKAQPFIATYNRDNIKNAGYFLSASKPLFCFAVQSESK